jgi:glycosyltransferase involved in cell wall biosynthesis
MSRSFRVGQESLRIVSDVPVEARATTAAEARSARIIDGRTRHILVTPDDVLAMDPPRDRSQDPVRRMLRAIRARTPLIYDDARDLELLRHGAPLRRAAPRRAYEQEFQPGGIHEGAEIVVAPAPADGAPRAVLIGLHWFELGGAERWAFEAVRIARDAGMLPIVVTNRDSHHPWIARPELDGALLMPFSEATSQSQTSGVEELLRALFRTFDIRGVAIHHNQWLYDRLHWIRRSRPEIPIVDSTHIVEYRGGGYPVSSALVEEVITAHHVISPSLARWMTEVQQIDPAKVVMAPLGGLTVDVASPSFRSRSQDEPLVVTFVGRMARQKAPEVFVAMAQKLRHRRDIRFIMHGDGEMASWVDDIIAGKSMGERIERLDSSIPVAATMERTHLLVVPSHNEGLTLTTLEAIAHGAAVVSTDVGAQRDLVPARALVPREAHRAAAGLARIVAGLADGEDSRRALWEEEREAERRLLAGRSASEWFAQEVSTW